MPLRRALNGSCALTHSWPCATRAPSVTAHLGGMCNAMGTFASLALMAVCAVCTLLCLILACVASYRLHEFQTVAAGFSESVAGMEWHYKEMKRCGGGDATRQAAAWGAEVLASVAAGVPADVAVRHSTACARELPVSDRGCQSHNDRYAASEAGSNASEMRGFGEDGQEWVATTERDLSNSDQGGRSVRAMTLLEFAGYQPPDTGDGLRQRLQSSPPRPVSLYRS